MKDAFYIDSLEQAQRLLKPQRIELLHKLDQPRTCPELATMFGKSPQQIYYHIKAMEKAGVVEKVSERRVRGTVEGHYQAVAQTYWLAPQLVGQVGSPRQAQDQASLRLLLSLTEEMQADIGRLGQKTEVGQSVPSLGLSAQIALPTGARRAAFLAEVQEQFQQLAEKYADEVDLDAQEGEPAGAYRLILACYPSHQTAK